MCALLLLSLASWFGRVSFTNVIIVANEKFSVIGYGNKYNYSIKICQRFSGPFCVGTTILKLLFDNTLLFGPWPKKTFHCSV